MKQKKKKNRKWLHAAALEPPRCQIDLRRCCLFPFEAKIFTVAAKLIALAHIPSEVGTGAPLCLEGVNNTFFKSVWVQTVGP